MAVATAASIGACSPAPLETLNYPETQAAFDTIRGYWPVRGFDLSATKLVTIGPGESFECTLPGKEPVEMNDTDSGVAAFCAVENSVAIAKTSYDDLVHKAADRGLTKEAIAKWVLGHEIGHAIQHAKKPLYGSSVQVELDADCIAGIVSEKRYSNSETTKKSDEFYKLLKSKGDHGTTQQRIDSFNHGKGGYC